MENENIGCGADVYVQEDRDGESDLIGCGEVRVKIKDGKEHLFLCEDCEKRK